MAESRTEPAFMKFLGGTIKTLPYGLSDELLTLCVLSELIQKAKDVYIRS